MNHSDPTNPKKIVKWSLEEDMVLPDLVLKHGANDWNTIANELADTFAHVVHYTPRLGADCEHRWKLMLKNGKKRGHWSSQEDQLIMLGIKKVLYDI